MARAKSNSINFFRVFAASHAPADFAARQFKLADATHARQAVLLEIGLLESARRIKPDSVIPGQVGIAYSRLGLAEESLGNTSASRAALDQAKVWYGRQHPSRELTDDQLKDAVKNFDRVMDPVRLN